MKQLKAFKYRIYPNNKQKQQLNQTFGCVRFVWNKLLEDFNSYNSKDNKDNIENRVEKSIL